MIFDENRIKGDCESISEMQRFDFRVVFGKMPIRTSKDRKPRLELALIRKGKLVKGINHI